MGFGCEIRQGVGASAFRGTFGSIRIHDRCGTARTLCCSSARKGAALDDLRLGVCWQSHHLSERRLRTMVETVLLSSGGWYPEDPSSGRLRLDQDSA